MTCSQRIFTNQTEHEEIQCLQLLRASAAVKRKPFGFASGCQVVGLSSIHDIFQIQKVQKRYKKGTKKVQKRYKKGTKKVQKRYHNRQLSSVYHLYHICTVVDFLRYGLQQRVDATIVHAIISLAQTASGTVCHCGKTCQGRQRFWRCSPSHWQNEFCDLDACGRCRTLPSSQVINIQYR